MPKLTKEQYRKLQESGLDDAKIKILAAQKGYDMSSSGIITSFVKGATKGFVGDIARPTAQLLQGLGQRAIAAVTPASLEEVRAQTGLRSLDDRTIEGQAVVEALRTEGGVEMAGRVVVNVASFFIPASPAAQVAGRATKAIGGATVKAGIGLSAKEAPLVQAYKARNPVPTRILAALTDKPLSGKIVTNAETALKNNLFGTETMIGIQAKRAATNIWQKVIAPALKGSPERIDMSDFIDEIAEQIDEIPELTRKNELVDALNAFKDDYRKVGKIGMEKLQQYKEGWARFLPDKVYKGRPIASSFREIQNMAASLARNKIYNALKEVEGKAAYFDYGNLKNLQAMGQKAMIGSKLKGGAGSFISGIYDKVVTPIATTGGLTLYKVGEGFEFVGNQGAKILGHLFR